MVPRKYLGAVHFNRMTRLVLGKRFMNSEGELDEQGFELKAIVANLVKLDASLTMAEPISWLRWMFSLKKTCLPSSVTVAIDSLESSWRSTPLPTTKRWHSTAFC